MVPTMTNPWDAVRAAIDAGDAPAAAAVVAGLDDAGRRAVARELPRYLPVARENGVRGFWERQRRRDLRWAQLERLAARTGQSVYSLKEQDDLFDGYDDTDHWMEPMRVAGSGTLPGPAAVAAWLNRRDFARSWEPPQADDVPLILQVLAARPEEWRADLAVRLALRLRGPRPDPDRRVRLALRLLRDTGVEPPRHAPLTLAWIAATAPGDLAADPLLDAMVSRLFEDEGVGRLLRDDRDWPAALAALALDGRVERETLLGGCVGRFLRGGQAADQRFFVRLHELVDPGAEEVAAYLRDYLAMLPAAAANVAEAALTRIRRLGSVPADQAGEAVEGLLFRAEGKLVRAGLSWLDRLLKDPAADVDAYAPALAAALMCESGEARERAVTLAVKHAARFGSREAETIRDVVATLPAPHGARLAAVFGGEAAAAPPSERFVPAPLPPAPAAAPMPAGVETPEALARIRPSEYDWLSSERWLDGFVRLAARHGSGRERDRLVAALAPLARHCDDERYRWTPWWDPAEWASAMARELAQPGAEVRAHPEGRLTAAQRVPEMTHSSAGRLMPLLRYAEVYQAQVQGRLPPYLLSTPTRANGLLDPEALVTRLEGYERDGAAALPLDFREALLRLGRRASAEVTTRATRLTSREGRRLAGWLTDRPAEPEVTLRRGSRQGDVRVFSEFAFGPEYEEVLGDLLVPRFHDESCERLLAVLAGHRELAAARCAWTLESLWPLEKPTLTDLDLLVTADGPAGQGMALILAHHLAEGPDGGAVPSFLHLAATGGLPGEELGRQLAALLRRRGDGPGDVIAALRSAAQQGAYQEVWRVMRGLLPGYLPGVGERATSAHTRVMRFAADTAEWADARGGFPVVAELAGRSRSTELVRQARRLHDRLTGPS